MAKYWEDHQVGEKVTTRGRTISQGLIDVLMGLGGFTAPFFLDEEFAKKHELGAKVGGRVAPGRLTLFLMGGMIESGAGELLDLESTVGLVGLNNVRFKAPLRAGDTIYETVELVEKRETKRRDVGLLIHKTVCLNQRGQELVEADVIHMVKRKPG